MQTSIRGCPTGHEENPLVTVMHVVLHPLQSVSANALQKFCCATGRRLDAQWRFPQPAPNLGAALGPGAHAMNAGYGAQGGLYGNGQPQADMYPHLHGHGASMVHQGVPLGKGVCSVLYFFLIFHITNTLCM